ncbi:hypothetical protein [Geopsychrobacter electrodiphilus]|uniref:hypothetical protein n=1 Tax=Geopsychrobacter electrodiphilus TaxID=225196 RepID=UPI000364B098|nr:hypothetical protein [Geopsychrobacter electrodiphilus]
MFKKAEIFRISNPSEFYQSLGVKFSLDPTELETATKTLPNLEKDLPIPGNIRDIGLLAELTSDIVWYLRSNGGTNQPIVTSDLTFMRKFAQFLKSHNHPALNRTGTVLPRHPKIVLPWEKFAFSIFLNNKIDRNLDGSMVQARKRIYIERLANRISKKFNIPITSALYAKIRKIREIAYYLKRKR